MERALLPFGPCLVAVVAMSCRGGEPSKTAHEAEVAPAPASTSARVAAPPMPTDLLLPSMEAGGSASGAPLPPPAKRPPCAKDEDCWSSTCCPATAAEHCVHSSLAQKCAIVDVRCAKSDVRFDCVCVEGQCGGRLHP